MDETTGAPTRASVTPSAARTSTCPSAGAPPWLPMPGNTNGRAPCRLRACTTAAAVLAPPPPQGLKTTAPQQGAPGARLPGPFDAQGRLTVHHAKHAAPPRRGGDDPLRGIGGRAVDLADLRHLPHRAEHIHR